MQSMLPFDSLFMELAGREIRTIRSRDSPGLPDGTFVFRELYCGDAHCDCHRVVLHVIWAELEETVATLIYALELNRPLAPGEPRVFLDPIGAQSELSEMFRAMVERMLIQDRSYHERLGRHYALWKEAIRDPCAGRPACEPCVRRRADVP